MDIKDLGGLSKPLTKLVEVIAAGVGAIARSYLVKRDADARAYEIEKVAQALSSTGLPDGRYEAGKVVITGTKNAIAQLAETPVGERVIERLSFREAHRQKNIELISQHAADELRDVNPDEVSSEPVDEDWVSRFFTAAQDVSSEEMQVLWGKILAGEVASPKSYSLRTLELVRNLSKDEALLFERLAKNRFDQAKGCFLINPDNHKFIEDALDISFQDILLLREAGLLVSNDSLVISFQPAPQDKNVFFEHGPMLVWLEIPAGKKIKNMGIVGFTNPGYQLSRIIPVVPNEDLVTKLATCIKSDDVKVKCGIIDACLKGQYKLREQKEL
jgi:hypothetical protein